MLDIQYIRDNSDLVKQKSEQKGYKVDINRLLELDSSRKELLGRTEELRRKRNENADKLKSGNPSDEDINVGKQIKVELAEQDVYLSEADTSFYDLLAEVPNMPTEDTPIGASEDENQVVYEWGEKPNFEFAAKNHWEIAESRGWIDKKRAARTSGSRFAYIMGDLVQLQLAIINWTISVLTTQDKVQEIINKFGVNAPETTFIPVIPPLMLKTEVYQAMDRLEPADDRYKIEGEDLWLQGSAEHVLGPLHMNETISETSLPKRYVGYATSFRKEAGTYGKDNEGIIRMHQFDKLELESFSTSGQGFNEHLFMIAVQEYLLQELKLPYRKLLKCTADIGKPNARGVDMDVWLPGQNSYRETHTADYMTDYQARRLKTKAKNNNGATELVHTNDATAFALGRTMVAIIENYQQADGTIKLPEVLKPFIGGRETL